MECYRAGGCGGYEMYSCSECPASKVSYITNPMVERLQGDIEKLKAIEGTEKIIADIAATINFLKTLKKVV